MSIVNNHHKLIELLACPDCRNDLIVTLNGLICVDCKKEFDVKNGIPLLYPSLIDVEHMKEEENLAKMMKKPRPGRKDRFSAAQWKYSKEEFWGMVQDNIEEGPKKLINIGCGFDSNFSKLELKGHFFVNFDLVYNMLNTLKSDYDAKLCVAGDIASLPFKKNSFDYLVCIDVIHHETDILPSLLESFRDLIKPGGCLFLEDTNVWGLFQFPKSKLLPKPLFKVMRSAYHRLKRSKNRPADYEFDTSFWEVKKILSKIGFNDIKPYPINSYPGVGPLRYEVYKFCSRIESLKYYNNYHYMLSAVKV